MSKSFFVIIIIVVFFVGPGFAKQPKSETIEFGPDGKVTFSTGAAGKKSDLLVKTSSVEDGIEVEVSLSRAIRSKLVAQNGKTYDRLSITGCGLTAEQVGLPAMPFKGFFLEIPYGVDISVEVLEEKLVSVGFGYKIYPLQPDEPDSGTEPIAFEQNQAAYSTDAFYPAKPIVINPPGFIRGRRIVFVQVFPFQYNPADGELRTFKKLRFKLKFEGTKEELRGRRRKRRLRTHQSEKLAESLILNYEALSIKNEESSTEELLLSESQGADYLIIVADNLYEEIQPLADWKHKKGYRTYVAKLSEVGSTKDDVKSYIQDAYDNWNPAPSFVLLVGDVNAASNNVPSDYFSYPAKSCVSDHPYSCVDGSDFYPDLTLGRLPANTESQCTTLVNKILEYDRWPQAGQWYDDFLAAAYFQDNGDDSHEIDDDGWADRFFMESAMTIYNFIVNTLGWEGYTALCTTYWPLTHATNNYHFDDDSFVPQRGIINLQHWGASPYPDPIPTWVVELWTSESQATSNISAAINAGVGLVYHRDHGGQTVWSNPYYNISYINALTNGRKTPVVLSINCDTGSFFRTAGDCFCEAFIKRSSGGAVGAVGATRMSYSGYNDLMVYGIFTSFWSSFDTTHTDTTYSYSLRPAEALNYGKYYMMTYLGTGSTTQTEFHMFHWFGDPEMNLYTTDPCTMNPTYLDMIAFGPHTFVVETGIPGALVCLSKPDEIYASGYADGTGHFEAEIEPLSAFEPMDITITAQNYYPHEDQVPVSTTPGDLYPDGNIDNNDLKVISAHWLENNQIPRSIGNILGWWQFDDGDGNTAADSSGYDNTGTLISGWSGGEIIVPNWVDGALEFSDGNDYVQTADDANKLQLIGSYTLSVWLKADAVQSDWAGILAKCAAGIGKTPNHWSLLFGGPGVPDTTGKLVVWNGTLIASLWDTQIELSDIAGQWHHICVVRSLNTMASYLDGKIVTYSTSEADPNGGYGHLNIGAERTARSCYKGLIGDVSIYDYQLTSDEVRELSLEHPVGQLVGWWNFDDGTADDSSGNDYHGTFMYDATTVIDGNIAAFDANNKALLLDGTDDYVNLGGGGSGGTWADMNDAMSIACWIKLPDGYTNDYQPAVAKSDSWQWYRNYNGNGIRFYTTNTTDTYINYEPQDDSPYIYPDDGQWHHTAATFDTEAGMRHIYIDGYHVMVEAVSGTIAKSTYDLAIGARLAYSNRWKGLIDDVRLYDYVLNHNAVKWLYEGSPASEPLDYLCFERPIGDVNGDCKVDLLDYAILALHWMESEGGS